MTHLSLPRFLVTAGSTREKIDRVRDWGNIFSGNTGLAIARALAEIGPVDLLTSNRQHVADLAQTAVSTIFPIEAAAFVTHADLRAALADRMTTRAYAGIFMTAAVSDYTPERVYSVIDRRLVDSATGCPDAGRQDEIWVVRNVHAGKVKSTHPTIAVLGRPTEKLIDLFRTEWGYKGLLVKFKLEVGISPAELLEIGERSRQASGADYLVANTLDMVEGPQAGAFILNAAGNEWCPRGALAGRLTEVARAWRSS